MITKYMRYGTARDYLKQNGWDLKKTVQLLFEVAKGMNHLHSRPSPILHSDLKGDNVLVDENGMAKVSDFGLSTIRDSLGGSTFAGGCIPYLAPEVFQSNFRGRRTDVCAFGLLMYELLSKGQTPFATRMQTMTTQEFARKIANDPSFRPLRPSNCPDLLWNLMSKCWAYDMDRRPYFDEVADELKRAGAGGRDSYYSYY
jgi:serine/threonine-protein kinase CTR1